MLLEDRGACSATSISFTMPGVPPQQPICSGWRRVATLLPLHTGIDSVCCADGATAEPQADGLRVLIAAELSHSVIE